MKVQGCPLAAVTLLSGFFLTSTFAQQPRVEIVQTGDRDLRRTAYRLRMCPEELRNARTALREAHNLAASVVRETWLGDIGHLWTTLDREHAGIALRELIDELRDLAEQSQDPNEYQHIINSARSLLPPLRELDPESAEACLAEWQEPDWIKALPNTPGLLEQMRQEQLQWLAHNDPDRAVEHLRSVEGQNPDIQVRSTVMSQLYHAGREEEAGALLDETLEKIPGIINNRASVWVVGQLASQAAQFFPDRLPTLLTQLATVPDHLPGDQPIDFNVGETRLSLSPKENLILNVARGLAGRPDAVGRVLELAPSLRAKLEPVGGLDGALSPRYRAPRRPSARQLAEESASGTIDSSVQAPPEEMWKLLQAAQELCVPDPDGARRILERSARLIASQNPLAPQSADLYNQVINTCLRCEGTVSREVIAQGNLLVGKLREQIENPLKSDPHASNAGGKRIIHYAPVDQLEASLVAVTAVEDFSGAMQMAKALREERVQFLAFQRIASLFVNR